MIFMKKIFLISTVLLISLGIKAQQENCPCSSDEDYQNALLNTLIGVEYSNPVAGYEGIQFLRDWAYGEILLASGEVIQNVIIRYDRYLDELLWLRIRDYRKAIINKDDILLFRLYREGIYPESLYVKKRIRLPYVDTAQVFVHELVQGKIEFFAYRNVKKEPVHNRLYDDTKHVISTQENDYLIRLRRKNLLAMPFINESEMKKILRQNHITLRDNEQGMALALRLYNSSVF